MKESELCMDSWQERSNQTAPSGTEERNTHSFCYVVEVKKRKYASTFYKKKKITTVFFFYKTSQALHIEG